MYCLGYAESLMLISRTVALWSSGRQTGKEQLPGDLFLSAPFCSVKLLSNPSIYFRSRLLELEDAMLLSDVSMNAFYMVAVTITFCY